ncbi:MAG: GAF domain-containing protein [Thermodesulfobacteriota bacterium]
MMGVLPPDQERWARRLAEVQAERNELVKLLGLIAQLSNLSTRRGASGATQEITDLLLHYLQADVCSLHLAEEKGELRLAAMCGVPPAPALSRRLETQVHKKLHCVLRLDDALGSDYLICLPVRSGDELLGVLGVIQRQEPSQNQLRHLNLALQAVIPLLENHLARLRLERVCQGLAEQARTSHDRLADLEAEATLQEASLEALLGLSLEPLFVIDETRRLLRHNPALPRLLGLDGQCLEGRFLGDFIRADQDAVSVLGSQPCPVELAAQCGGRVSALLQLVPVKVAGRAGLKLGRLSPGQRPAADLAGRLPRELEGLGGLAGEVVNQANNMLMALRSQIELMLMSELSQAQRQRLELIESLVLDGGAPLARLREGVERLERLRRDLGVQLSLWPDQA